VSEYLDNLKKWSKNDKLIFATNAWCKAIRHIEEIEKENEGLNEFLSKARCELHRMMVDIPLKYQSKEFLGICQDIGYYEGDTE